MTFAMEKYGLLCPGSLIEGKQTRMEKCVAQQMERDPKSIETTPVLAPNSRLSAASRHQPLANSLLILLGARDQSRFLRSPSTRSLLYGYKVLVWHCKMPKEEENHQQKSAQQQFAVC